MPPNQEEHTPTTGKRQLIGLILGPALFTLMLLTVNLDAARPEVTRMAAATVWIAVWWITEPIPIPATSLLPLVLFPLMNLVKGDKVAASYMNSSIMLFLGGFLIALTIERWQLHKRLALGILRLVGDNPRLIVLGFMAATGFISMWISNTATAMMMLPIALAIIARADESPAPPKFKANFALVLMLAVAYASSIGGVGTLVGTPPNIAFMRIYAISFPEATPVSFLQWMTLGVPTAIIFLIVAWFVMVYWLVPVGKTGFAGGRELVAAELKQLGQMSRAEKRVAAAFFITALLWITRVTIDLGRFKIPGWSDLLGLGGMLDDGTVAIGMGTLLFLLPSGTERGERLLNWETAKRLPWGILLLFGGGFALADGFQQSGLSVWLGQRLEWFAGAPTIVMVAATCTLLTFLTELTSNTATTNLTLPILAALSRATGIHPLLLMIPATISASFAFMLPVGTPPNAIVFGSGRVPIVKMAAVGFVMNWIGVVLATALTLLVAVPVFQIK